MLVFLFEDSQKMFGCVPGQTAVGGSASAGRFDQVTSGSCFFDHNLSIIE